MGTKPNNSKRARRAHVRHSTKRTRREERIYLTLLGIEAAATIAARGCDPVMQMHLHRHVRNPVLELIELLGGVES